VRAWHDGRAREAIRGGAGTRPQSIRAAHDGNAGDGEVVEGAEELRDVHGIKPVLFHGAAGHGAQLGEVEAGAEVVCGSADDDYLSTAILGGSQGDRQLLDHAGRQRVAALRPVERDGQDAAGLGPALLHQDGVVVRHDRPSRVLCTGRNATVSRPSTSRQWHAKQRAPY